MSRVPFLLWVSPMHTYVRTQVAKITKQLEEADLFSMKLMIVQANEKLDAMLLSQKEASKTLL